MRHLYHLAVLWSLLATPVIAAAQPNRVNVTPTPGILGNNADIDDDGSNLPGQDQDMLVGATQANLRDIQLGQIALRRATSPSVRNLARRRVDDHTAAQAELSRIAALLRYPLPLDVSSSDADTVEYFQFDDPEKFDSDYVNQVIHDSDKDIEDYQDELDEGQVAALVVYAQRHLPVLQAELAQATAIQRLEDGGINNRGNTNDNGLNIPGNR